MAFHRSPGSFAWILLVAVTGVSACQDEVVVADRGALPEEIAALPAGVHPIVSIPSLETASVGGTVLLRIYLHQVEMEDEIASYQGVFRYEPGAIEIQSGTFPEGILGAWNLVEPGLIRFAGAVIEGIGTRPVLELRGRLKKMPADDDFFVQMEEIVAAEKLEVMTDAVVQAGEVPILTSADLDFSHR